jgi:pyruvate/2-oxoglutarate dehydrogenase complex dihydrolipoamide dehydrogenase (E3) component
MGSIRSDRSHYNMVVIGAGSAGLVTSYIASFLKAKVALIEEHAMGGDCLNTGCVPSKALIKTAKLVHQIKNHKKYGLTHGSCEVDLNQVMERVHQVIKEISPHDSIARYEALGVECIQGHADIIDPHHISVNGKELRTKSLVLALGASPFVPNIPGLKEVSPLTSDSIWNLKILPQKLVVLGAGPIGCELAQAFVRLGSEVFLIDKGLQILPREDPDMARWVHKSLLSDGVKIYLGYEAREITYNGRRTIHLESKNANPEFGTKLSLDFDQILVAVGRKARTNQFDWKKLGISLNEDGTLKADKYLRVNGRAIYACGDVVGPYQLTHAAAHQAWYCAVNGLFSPFKKYAVDYRVIPWVTFTDPELARVGLSEKEAQANKITYELTRYRLDDFDRAIADSEVNGEIKIITHPQNDQILGACIVGSGAGEMLPEFTMALKWRMGLKSILRTIHPYPTWSEANKYGASTWAREHSARMLTRLTPILSGFHRWRR